ncbi:cytochrome P450 2U1-like [Mercenaria mercenaria]|uniref:cytochrome P450 2U1-like n=1 Tax=Mercenaria mercenaria TaxID=6596 RepID=UPI00234F7800|nr:cytochrome P450 2U1-like [Mercenaria mercenaria]
MEAAIFNLFVYILSFQSSLFASVLAGFLLLIVYSYIRQRNIPPGPYALPILGSVGFFRAFKQRRHLVLSDLAEKYGNIFSVYAGTRLVVFLNGYDVIREAFVKNALVFSERPNWLPSLQNGLSEGKGLVWQGAGHAGSARKFAVQALREFGLGKTSLQDKVLREMNAVSSVFKQRTGKPFRMKTTLKKAITNVIHDIVFGKRFNLDEDGLNRLTFLIDEFFRGGIFIPKNFLPKILSTLLPKNEEEYQRKQKVIGELKQYIYGSIAEHEQDFDSHSIRDFIDLYINASKHRNDVDSSYIPTKGEVFRIILDLFLAGSETTASTLDWCFMFMVKYPDIQEKCYQEITQLSGVYSDKAHIDWARRQHLPYVEATLTEVQRLASIVPLGLPHVTSKTVALQGYVIPKDTIVFANLYSCSMDRIVWNGVNEFNPERHIDANSQFKRNEKLIPFSIGARMCLGDSMAKLEIFIMFTNLIKRFKFTKFGDSDLSVAHVKVDHPVASAENFEVIITER